MVTWKPISESYDQWLVDRLNSLGASEVSIVCFGSKYTSNLELFYNKIGMPRRNFENLRMYIGKGTEKFSANSLWQYYDESEQSVVDNARSNNIIRKCELLKTTAFNSKFPHLSASPDGKILPFGKNEGRCFGSLELKNTQSSVLKSYGDNLPIDNVTQITTQMMATEWNYGELFYFIDNAKCQLNPIDKKTTKPLQNIILERTTPFWESVLICRPLFNQMYNAKLNMNMRLVAELEREIASHEPPAQNTIGYLNFLSERFKERTQGIGIIKGSDEQFLIAKKHKEISKKIDKLEADQRMMEVELKNIIKENNILDFGAKGKVSWYTNKNDKRIFLNKVI